MSICTLCEELGVRNHRGGEHILLASILSLEGTRMNKLTICIDDYNVTLETQDGEQIIPYKVADSLVSIIMEGQFLGADLLRRDAIGNKILEAKKVGLSEIELSISEAKLFLGTYVKFANFSKHDTQLVRRIEKLRQEYNDVMGDEGTI
jgi:hypothetical protein